MTMGDATPLPDHRSDAQLPHLDAAEVEQHRESSAASPLAELAGLIGVGEASVDAQRALYQLLDRMSVLSREIGISTATIVALEARRNALATDIAVLEGADTMGERTPALDATVAANAANLSTHTTGRTPQMKHPMLRFGPQRSTWQIALATGIVTAAAAATLVASAGSEPNQSAAATATLEPTLIAAVAALPSPTSTATPLPTPTVAPPPTVMSSPTVAPPTTIAKPATPIPVSKPAVLPGPMLSATRGELRDVFGTPTARTIAVDEYAGVVVSVTPTGFVSAISIDVKHLDAEITNPLAWLIETRPADARLLESMWLQPGTLRLTYVSRSLAGSAASIGLEANTDPSRLIETIGYDPNSGEVTTIVLSFAASEP